MPLARADYSLGGSITNANNYSLNGDISGGIIYTRRSGFFFTQQAQDTFAIIDADGIAGVSTGSNSETNSRGFGLYDGLNPYYYNDITLQDTQYETGRLSVYSNTGIPVEGAILYEHFKGKTGQGLFIRLGKDYAGAAQIKDTTTGQAATNVYGALYYFDLVNPKDTINVLDGSHHQLTQRQLPKHLSKVLTIS